MVDFVAAFKHGLDTAEEAINNRAEIDAVFTALNEQIGQASEQRLKLSRREFFERTAPLDFSHEREKYQAIAAEHREIMDTPIVELARWSAARSGYPCVLSFDEMEYECQHKADLEEALCHLLADTRIGEKLFRLLQLDPAELNTDFQKDSALRTTKEQLVAEQEGAAPSARRSLLMPS